MHPYRRIIPVVLASVLLVAVSAIPAFAQGGVPNQWELFERTYYVPCAAGGAGENVLVSGTIHLVGGGAHDPAHWNAYFSGVGQTTGDRYQGTWIQNIIGHSNLNNGQSVYSERYSAKLVGPGKNNNFYQTGVLRFVVNATGEPVVEFEGGSVEFR